MVSQIYDRVAERYDGDWANIYSTSRAHCIRQIVKHFGNERRSIDAMDFAVGTGNAFSDLRHHFNLGNCTGFDISGGMLSLAERKLSQQVTLLKQDAKKAVDFVKPESVDLAMSHFLLNFVEADHLLESSLKLLRPGGVLSLITSTQQSLSELHSGRFRHAGRILGVRNSLNKMSTPKDHQSCLNKLQQHGFEIIEETVHCQKLSFNSFADVRSWAVDSGWMVSSMDNKLGLRIALGRLILGILEISMHPLYPLQASTEISVVLARKPENRETIRSAA